MIPLQARFRPRGWGALQLYSSVTAALEGVSDQQHAPAELYPRERPGTHLQEAGWVPGPVLTGGKSRSNGIRSPDRPARSQSLYRLSYPAHNIIYYNILLYYNIILYYIII